MPLARIDHGKAAANDADARDAVYYFHNDVSGLPEELTDAGGELVWQARYKVWGNAAQEEWVARVPQRPTRAWGEVQAAPVPTHAPRPQNLRFQGQYLDRETGLHYNTFRFYDPDIGRFINPDPIGLAGGRNLYQYAPNPISWIDPWGWAVTPLDAPGYSTYGLYEPGANEPYYVGHTGQSLDDRLSEHVGTGRATRGRTEIRSLEGPGGTLTYSQAKGYEQAYREKFNTKTGFPGNVIEPINKLRADERGLSHVKFYNEKAKEIGLGRCGGK